MIRISGLRHTGRCQPECHIIYIAFTCSANADRENLQYTVKDIALWEVVAHIWRAIEIEVDASGTTLMPVNVYFCYPLLSTSDDVHSSRWR